ncbi:hypothetical protein SDC9_136603 [bioreactor metagenome]|uniref:Uncharacterized protein n=1 Tax=bioreactor metagenome TaxID=1076179 RepID=A0A645DJ57_9ZZZZ
MAVEVAVHERFTPCLAAQRTGDQAPGRLAGDQLAQVGKVLGLGQPAFIDLVALGEFEGHVLHGAVVGRSDHDLEAIQRGIELVGYLLLAAIVAGFACVAGETVGCTAQRGKHVGSAGDDGSDQVAQQGCLARARWAIDPQQPLPASKRGQNGVHSQLLGMHKPQVALGRPATVGIGLWHQPLDQRLGGNVGVDVQAWPRILAEQVLV